MTNLCATLRNPRDHKNGNAAHTHVNEKKASSSPGSNNILYEKKIVGNQLSEGDKSERAAEKSGVKKSTDGNEGEVNVTAQVNEQKRKRAIQPTLEEKRSNQKDKDIKKGQNEREDDHKERNKVKRARIDDGKLSGKNKTSCDKTAERLPRATLPVERTLENGQVKKNTEDKVDAKVNVSKSKQNRDLKPAKKEKVDQKERDVERSRNEKSDNETECNEAAKKK